MKGWIYIIQFGNRDLVKVGMSEGDSPLPRIKVWTLHQCQNL